MNYNPLVPEVQENPYPYYAYLRRHAPVYKVEPQGWWAIARYDDIMSVVRSPQLFSSQHFFAGLTLEDSDPLLQDPIIMSLDPPAHTRLRKLANRAFTPRIVGALEPHIREITQELLAQRSADRTFDLVRDLAAPLPVRVIAELLGVEPERRDDFKRWTDAWITAAGGMGTVETHAQRRQDIAEFHAYFQHMIEVRRKEPKSDLISALVRAQDEGQMLTAGEVFNLATFLLIAGNETTTNLIGNTVLALLRHPQELAKAQANPALLPNLIEEGLRYDGPVQSEFRHATQDVTVGGTTIPAEAPVMVLFASGNHDEEIFAEPERFDVTRQNAPENIAFGHGIHFCLGAPLARLEARIALEALLPWLPHLSWQEEHVKRNVSMHQIRGLSSFPVTFRPQT